MHSGGAFTVRLPVPHRLGRWALPGMVAVLGIGLAIVGWIFASKRPRAPSVPALLDSIARLDAAHSAGVDGFIPDEWARYQAERARLKSLIVTALAAGGTVG